MGGGTPLDDRQQGFTLIEILVSLVILSFVALGIAGLFSHSMIVNASGHDYAVLASEARFALEALQGMPWNDPALVDTAGGERTWTPNNPNFVIRYTVEDYSVENWIEAAGTWQAPDTSIGEVANLKRITMTVASTNQVLRGERTFTVTSLKIPG
jgi:prepilin-type N-terminal cleavage/methylation domain-containing protein